MVEARRTRERAPGGRNCDGSPNYESAGRMARVAENRLPLGTLPKNKTVDPIGFHMRGTRLVPLDLQIRPSLDLSVMDGGNAPLNPSQPPSICPADHHVVREETSRVCDAHDGRRHRGCYGSCAYSAPPKAQMFVI